jgi:hypothetical protein
MIKHHIVIAVPDEINVSPTQAFVPTDDIGEDSASTTFSLGEFVNKDMNLLLSRGSTSVRRLLWFMRYSLN